VNLSAIFIKETVNKNDMKIVQLAWPLSGYKPLKLGSHVPKHSAGVDMQAEVDIACHAHGRIATDFLVAVVP
jgi:hypothetical protein